MTVHFNNCVYGIRIQFYKKKLEPGRRLQVISVTTDNSTVGYSYLRDSEGVIPAACKVCYPTGVQE